MQPDVKRSKEKVLQDRLEFIYRNAMGNVLVLDSAPTTASDLKGNTTGYYDDAIYFKLADGTFKKFSVTDV